MPASSARRARRNAARLDSLAASHAADTASAADPARLLHDARNGDPVSMARYLRGQQESRSRAFQKQSAADTLFMTEACRASRSGSLDTAAIDAADRAASMAADHERALAEAFVDSIVASGRTMTAADAAAIAEVTRKGMTKAVRNALLGLDD